MTFLCGPEQLFPKSSREYDRDFKIWWKKKEILFYICFFFVYCLQQGLTMYL